MLGKENLNSENRYCNSATIRYSYYVENKYVKSLTI